MTHFRWGHRHRRRTILKNSLNWRSLTAKSNQKRLNSVKIRTKTYVTILTHTVQVAQTESLLILVTTYSKLNQILFGVSQFHRPNYN